MPSPRVTAARGFSFVELLFAIAVLGIGFIMIAAIFPIGLQQTKLTLDETAGAASARGTCALLQQMSQSLIAYSSGGAVTPPAPIMPTPYPAPTLATLPPPAVMPNGTTRLVPGQVRSFRDSRDFGTPNNNVIRDDTVWKRISGNLLNASNGRNASAVLFKRDWVATKDAAGTTVTIVPSGSAQLFVINAQVANASEYAAADVFTASSQPLFNLQPRPVGLEIYQYSDSTWVAQFSPIATAQGFSNAEVTANANSKSAVSEGAYVVISDDRITTPLADRGRMNGRIYRIGVQRPDVGTDAWQLDPGYEFKNDPGNSGVYDDTGATGDDDIRLIGQTTNVTGSKVAVAGPAVAFVLGRGFTDPTVPGVFAGPAMDVSVYTTFVSVP